MLLFLLEVLVEEQVTEDHLVVQVIHLLLVHHKVILEEVRNTHSHLSADEIYARVRKRLPRVSLGTVRCAERGIGSWPKVVVRSP